ncbi:MAG: hypothetical protein ACSHW0_08700 [Thalassotalea sp.]
MSPIFQALAKLTLKSASKIKSSRKKLLLTSVTFACVLVACSEQKLDSKTVTQAPVPDMALSNITDKAWLRDLLPNNALGYARMPSLWYLFNAQDNGFQYAQGNESFVAQIKQLQVAVKQNLFTKFKLESGLAKFMLTHLDGPVEMAVLQPELGQMMPVLSFASYLDFADSAEFKTNFEQALLSEHLVALNTPTNEQGKGVMSAPNMLINYHFDAKTKRFSLNAGLGIDTAAIERIRQTLVVNTDHTMFAAEQKIDESGLGLFVWLNPKMLLPAVVPLIGQETVAQLQAAGLNQMNGIALGYGVSDKKTRLKTLIDMPMAGLRQYLPAINNDIKLTAVGDIAQLAVLSLPTAKDLGKFEQGFISVKGELPAEYIDFKTQVKTELGQSLEGLMTLAGPEMLYFSDEISDFFAIKVNDEKGLLSFFDKLVEKGVVELANRNVKGQNIYQLTMTGDMMNEILTAAFKDKPEIGELFSNIKSRYYFIFEQGYLISSSIPQPLLERQANSKRTDINTWLAKQQHQDFSGSLLAYTTSIDDLSRSSYHVYLAVLQVLADISQASFDIYTLPLASELAFNDKGTLGMKIDISDPFIAVEISFEQSLFDVFYAGGYESAAVVGILAAVALPAYQEYVEKAKQAQNTTTP